MAAPQTFVWPDYLVFGISLFLSVGIGIFFTIKERNHTSNEEFLMAGRSMPIIPITASTFATMVSSIGFVAYPVEIYYFGFGYFFFVLGNCLSVFPIAEVFIPAFHQMNLVSAFQYLEETFNPVIRRAASLVQIFLMFLVMGMMTYAPSVSLAQVSGINVWGGIILTTAVCTFYTTFGGMRAVVWADTIQMFLMFAGVVMLAFKGISDLGGWQSTMKIARDGGRISQFNWNPDPFVRSGFWAYVVGGFFQAFIPLSSTQIAIQRYCTVPTVRQAKISAYLIAPTYMILGSIILLVGLSMYGHFADCDPLEGGQVDGMDQVLGDWPGLPGLFIACIFAASLSTLSSGQNAIAANILKDMVEPWYVKKYERELSERKAFIIAKCIVFVIGILVMCSSFITVALGGNLFMLISKVAGIFAGPMSGLFTIAIVMKSVRNVKAITFGFFASTAICLWIGVGAQFYNFKPNRLPISISGCGNYSDANNFTGHYSGTPKLTTVSGFQQETIPDQEPHGFARIYNLSPLYFGTVGYSLTIILSFVVDRLARCCSTRRKEVHEHDTTSEEAKRRDNSCDYAWAKESPNRLSKLNSYTFTKKDMSSQTEHSIPPHVKRELLVVDSRECSL